VLLQKLDFTIDELKRLSLNGIEASFLTRAEKQQMTDQFEEEWQSILKTTGKGEELWQN
jgi:adenosine deaminase